MASDFASPRISAFVAGDASKQVDPDGRFILPEPKAPGSAPIITRARAAELADAFLRSWGKGARKSWERERGGPIDVESLRRDSRAFYAETPHELVPSSAHPAGRRHFGPYYLVHFRSGGQLVLTVAVSAYATDLSIDSGGRVVSPLHSGEFFKVLTVPLPASTIPFQYAPLSPEEAVSRVADATGARVTSVPELIHRDRDWHPALAQWKVTLDRPVRVRRVGSGAESLVHEVYLGPDNALRVPAAAQPASRTITLWRPNSVRPKEPGQTVDHVLARRPHIPVEFDDVTLAAEL